jgi:hypothetical protein
MMNANIEIDAWRGLWQSRSDALSAADLRDRVARETRRRIVALVIPVLVSLGIGGWMLARAVEAPDFDNLLLAAETWTFIAATWAGSLWISRGSWRPTADTTAAFIDISISRCRATLRGLRLGAILYAAQFSFGLFWKLRYTSVTLTDLATSWPVVVLGWLGGPILLACFIPYARAKSTELEYLRDLRRQVIDE